MKRWLLMAGGMALLMACQNNAPVQNTTPVPDSIPEQKRVPIQNNVPVQKQDTVNNGPLAVEFFSTLPETIEGCSGLYTYDTTDIEDYRYVFASKMNEFAVIHVNGQDIYMEIKDPKDQFPDSNATEIYEGNGYKAVLNMKEIEVSGEVGRYEGTLEITKGTEKITIKLHGLAGC